MTASHALALASALALVACSQAASPAPTTAPAPSRDDAACKDVSEPTRVVATAGGAVPFGAATIAAADAGFAITIGDRTTTWVPAPGDVDRFVAVGDLCIRAIDRATLDVADRPGASPAAAKPKMPRCTIQCCTTEESRKPAPGGEIECCFCDDDSGSDSQH